MCTRYVLIKMLNATTFRSLFTNVKCMCAKQAFIHKEFSDLIGPNDFVHYHVTQSPACCRNTLYFTNVNWRIYTRHCLLDHVKTTLCMAKSRDLRYVLTYNVIWANQNTDSFVYRWLRALAMIEVTRFPAFVGVSDVISAVMLRRQLTE